MSSFFLPSLGILSCRFSPKAFNIKTHVISMRPNVLSRSICVFGKPLNIFCGKVCPLDKLLNIVCSQICAPSKLLEAVQGQVCVLDKLLNVLNSSPQQDC